MNESNPGGPDHRQGRLPVGAGHELFFEVAGRGLPAVVLHGGPGSGTSPGLRRRFDHDRWRVTTFDQRAAGRSTPSAGNADSDLSAVTTPHLVADINWLREHLGIARWLVWGGSWGSTLALAYAQAHPDRVSAVVLEAVTAGTRRELDWITRDMGRIFPAEWERFRDHLPPADRDGDLAAGYSTLLHSPDPAVRAAAAAAWCRWEDTHVSLAAPEPSYSRLPSERQLGTARQVTWFWSQNCFLAPGQLLAGMPALAGIPGVLVTGRRDISSPADTAWLLHRAWPGSELHIVEGDGHGGDSMRNITTAAIDRLADRLSTEGPPQS